VKTVRVRPSALSDIAEIRRYTRKAWGAAQARSYLAGLGAQFEAIADGTAQSVLTDTAYRPFRRCRYKKHLIFFDETEDSVDIVRVLHPRSNLAVRLEKD